MFGDLVRVGNSLHLAVDHNIQSIFNRLSFMHDDALIFGSEPFSLVKERHRTWYQLCSEQTARKLLKLLIVAAAQTVS